MAVREVTLTIKPVADAAAVAKAQTALDKADATVAKTNARLRDAKGHFVKQGEEIARNTTALKKQQVVSESMWKGVRSLGSEALESVGRGIDALGHKLEKLREKAKDSAKDFGKEFGSGAFRTMLGSNKLSIGESLGEGAVELIKKTFEEGAQQRLTKERITREFGKDFNLKTLFATGDRVGLRGGIQGDDALRALTPALEAINDVQAGSKLRGRTLSGSQAAAYREAAIKRAGSMFERISALMPNLDSETLGFALSEAGTGPEGLKRFAATLGLSRVKTRRLTKDVESGKLTSTEAVAKLLEESGVTEEAAEKARGRFDFQVRSIKAQLVDRLGDIGSTALDTLNEKLGKSGSLAEKLTKYLESDAGKKNIDMLAKGLSSVVEGLIDVAQQIPAAFKWLEDHRDLIEGLGKVVVGMAKATGWTIDKLGAAGGWVGDTAAKLGMPNDRETRALNEVDFAKRLARRVASGELGANDAAYQFQGFAKSSEGAGGPEGITAFAQRLRENLRKGDAAAVLEMTPEQALMKSQLGATVGSTPTVHLTVQTLADLNPAWVQKVMPEIEKGLHESTRRSTAGGAAGF